MMDKSKTRRCDAGGIFIVLIGQSTVVFVVKEIQPSRSAWRNRSEEALSSRRAISLRLLTLSPVKIIGPAALSFVHPHWTEIQHQCSLPGFQTKSNHLFYMRHALGVRRLIANRKRPQLTIEIGLLTDTLRSGSKKTNFIMGSITHRGCMFVILTFCATIRTLAGNPSPPAQIPISVNQIGVLATKEYQGDGLSITASADGARLRCVFQRLEGRVTPEGLWLHSVSTDLSSEPFRIRARAVRRTENPDLVLTGHWSGVAATPGETGKVFVTEGRARYIRPGLTEEYFVSADGIRQDFVIEQRPVDAGLLRVELDVTGAIVEGHSEELRLTPQGTAREIIYHQLSVTDVRGQKLAARFEIVNANQIAVLVDDATAVYPVRIDPTFSDANWISMGGIPGVNGPVYVATVDDAGNVYIGGNFTVAGDVVANRVAKWNGSSWSALGSGIEGVGPGGSNPYINALAFADGNLYVGGYFTNAGGILANRIAKWDGNSWSALGSGMNGGVFALATIGNDLYAGGDFTAAGGIATARIAKWNGSAWAAVGLGVDSAVFALAAAGSDLIVGGNFVTAANSDNQAITVNSIARWDGIEWSPLDLGINGNVSALAVAGNEVYAGGQFTTAGGALVNNVARWDGDSWSALGLGVGNGSVATVNALAVSGGVAYVGGYFTTVTNSGGDTVAANNIAKWDGSNWSALGTGILGNVGAVSALAMTGGSLYAGGSIQTADGIVANNFAMWNGNAWSALGSGMNNPVSALAMSGSDVYVGGGFQTVGGLVVNNVAKWNGSIWSGLGSGLNSNVLTLAIAGSDLYVGGYFTIATNNGGTIVAVNRIAKWDGTNWSAVAGGMNNAVTTIISVDTNLYVGGAFTVATNSGGAAVQVNRIAKWNGNNWSALGLGLNNSVLSIARTGNNIYAGGFFTAATNGNGLAISAQRIARWDGSNWSSLALGLNNYVYSIAGTGTNFYVGGDFTLATNTGGTTIIANRIVHWNGSRWDGVGGGMDGRVNAIVLYGPDVFVAGGFHVATNNASVTGTNVIPASPVSAMHIAKWDGSSWTTLGSGLDGPVSELAVAGSTLYVGGSFYNAGGKVSAFIAQAIEAIPFSGRLTILDYSATNGLRIRFTGGQPGNSYRIQSSPSLSPTSWTDYTNFTYTSTKVFSVTAAGSETNQFFRAVTP